MEEGKKKERGEEKKRSKVWFRVLNIFCTRSRGWAFEFSSERGLDINILNEGWTRKNG